MDYVVNGAHIFLSFVAVISVIVFVHEFGHYAVAKLCGVRISAFSIGFGRELFGITDRSGTRWKFSLLPFGGYVKMYGDASAASTADIDALARMDASERAVAFHYQPLYKKALVVVAGPVANFLLTITIYTWLIMSNGLATVEPVVGKIVADSPAQAAGLKIGDRITRINDDEVSTFADIPHYIITNLGTPVTLYVQRGSETLTVTLTPKQIEDQDDLGNKITRPLIGIGSNEMTRTQVGLARAVQEAGKRTYRICATTLDAIGQMITGKRDTQDLRGAIGMAQLSGQAAEKGATMVIFLIAAISANLGLVNLLPIPMLDGGWLLFYSIEALRGRPLAQKVQEYSFRLGFGFIAALMAFTIINDVRRLVF